MTTFTVNKDKCNKDSICVSECPVGIIELRENALTPNLIDGGEELCINCGHCVAVCPAGAISLSSMLLEECREVEPEHLPSAEQFTHLVKNRRSIRKYKEKAVEKEKLSRIFDAVRYAPTSKNTQLINWLVVNDKEILENYVALTIDWMKNALSKKDPMAAAFQMERVVSSWEKGFDPILRGAPNLVVAYGPAAYPGAVIDSTIALSIFELAAFTEGLGTCWAGFFMIGAGQWPPLQEALELPDGQVTTGAMMVGYPKRPYKRVPLRNEAKITWR